MSNTDIKKFLEIVSETNTQILTETNARRIPKRTPLKEAEVEDRGKTIVRYAKLIAQDMVDDGMVATSDQNLNDLYDEYLKHYRVGFPPEYTEHLRNAAKKWYKHLLKTSAYESDNSRQSSSYPPAAYSIAQDMIDGGMIATSDQNFNDLYDEYMKRYREGWGWPDQLRDQVRAAYKKLLKRENSAPDDTELDGMLEAAGIKVETKKQGKAPRAQLKGKDKIKSKGVKTYDEPHPASGRLVGESDLYEPGLRDYSDPYGTEANLDGGRNAYEIEDDDVDEFSHGDTVRVKDHVKRFGGKTGRVEDKYGDAYIVNLRGFRSPGIEFFPSDLELVNLESELDEEIVPVDDYEGKDYVDDETGELFTNDEIIYDVEKGIFVERPRELELVPKNDDITGNPYDVKDHTSKMDPVALSMFGDIAAAGGDAIDYILTNEPYSMADLDAEARAQGYADAQEWADSYSESEEYTRSTETVDTIADDILAEYGEDEWDDEDHFFKNEPQPVDCPECEGGRYSDPECGTCGGAGQIFEDDILAEYGEDEFERDEDEGYDYDDDEEEWPEESVTITGDLPAASYWGKKGRYQNYTDQLQKLIPVSGPIEDAANRPALEKFRILGNIYYDVYNNGLWDEGHGQRGVEMEAEFGLGPGERITTDELEKLVDRVTLNAWREHTKSGAGTEVNETLEEADVDPGDQIQLTPGQIVQIDSALGGEAAVVAQRPNYVVVNLPKGGMKLLRNDEWWLDDPDVDYVDVDYDEENPEELMFDETSQGIRPSYTKPADDRQNNFFSKKKVDEDETTSDEDGANLFDLIKGWKPWSVWIKNNYYDGRYADYSSRPYTVIAASPEEAKQVVLDNADAILDELLTKKFPNGKKVLPPKSALPITHKNIGKIWKSRIVSTGGPKEFWTPRGRRKFTIANRKFVVDEGYKIVPSIDTVRYTERDGLEGPFRTQSGKVVYYDPKEGKYYDPDTDFYLSHDEFAAHDKDPYSDRLGEAGYRPNKRNFSDRDWSFKGTSQKRNFKDREIRHELRGEEDINNYAIFIDGKYWKAVKNVKHAAAIVKSLKSKGKNAEYRYGAFPMEGASTHKKGYKQKGGGYNKPGSAKQKKAASKAGRQVDKKAVELQEGELTADSTLADLARSKTAIPISVAADRNAKVELIVKRRGSLFDVFIQGAGIKQAISRTNSANDTLRSVVDRLNKMGSAMKKITIDEAADLQEASSSGLKIGRDRNGNTTLIISPEGEKGFSIQTNGNLIQTHRDAMAGNFDPEVAYREAKEFIDKFGNDRQKRILKLIGSDYQGSEAALKHELEPGEEMLDELETATDQLDAERAEQNREIGEPTQNMDQNMDPDAELEGMKQLIQNMMANPDQDTEKAIQDIAHPDDEMNDMQFADDEVEQLKGLLGFLK